MTKRSKLETITLGSGNLYSVAVPTAYPTTLTAIKTLCTDGNMLGRIKGGASIEYSAEYYEASDDSGVAKKTAMTAESATLKSGLITWNGETFKKIIRTARVADETGSRVTKIGGIGNEDKTKQLIIFAHNDNVDGDVYVTMTAQSKSGFTLQFAKDSETVLDAEFAAVSSDDEGTLITIYEDTSAAK